jgi:hypothetical protein
VGVIEGPGDDEAELSLDALREGIADDRQYAPLAELCNGKPISMRRYWQAVTVVELLTTAPHYRQRLPKLLAALRESGSTDLGPHLATVLQSDWPQLAADWRSECQRRYVAAEK